MNTMCQLRIFRPSQVQQSKHGLFAFIKVGKYIEEFEPARVRGQFTSSVCKSCSIV